MEDLLARAVGHALGSAVVASAPVHGGDVAVAYRVDLADGRRVFAKTHRSPPPGFFSTEAAGLRWLRDPAVVAVPVVLAVGDGDDGRPPHLVLEWIEVGDRRAGSAAELALGRALAALHGAGACPVLRPRGPAHHRQPGPPQRAVPILGRVLRDAAPRSLGPART